MKYLHIALGFCAATVGAFAAGVWISSAFFYWTYPGQALVIAAACVFILEMALYVLWAYAAWRRRRSWLPLFVLIILNIGIAIGAVFEIMTHWFYPA